jgi:MoaA/NifB/PqqE/SkfB family radical SAM enzyme
MAPRSKAFFDGLKNFFPNSHVMNLKKTLKLLKDRGFDPDQLYAIDNSQHDTADISEKERWKVLRFFETPMSPGYLIQNGPFTTDMLELLIDVLDKKIIIPVSGVPLQMTVDRAKWEFYRTLDASYPPSEVQLNITNRCVNRCRMCRKYEWDQIDMPIQKFGEIVGELRNMGARLLILSGGEPFLHDDIEGIVDMTEGMETLIFTSGAVPISEGMLKKAKRLQFSVDALDPEIYRFIRGPGDVDTVKENILKAKAAGCSVAVTTVIQRANIFHIPDIIDFCKKENVPFLPGAVHSYDNVAFYNLNNRRLPPTCVVPFYHCLVDPSGDVFVCCHHHEDNADYERIDRRYVLGNVFQARFPDIWFSKKAKDIRNSLFADRAAFCQGCFRYLLENDTASFVRSHEVPEEFPYTHTYFFAVVMMADLSVAE